MTVLCDSCSPKRWCTADKNRTECRFYQPMTEQEYIQNCNTEQLGEFLFGIAYMCSYCGDDAHSTEEKIQQCHFGKCCCQRQDWAVWLKQPHSLDLKRKWKRFLKEQHEKTKTKKENQKTEEKTEMVSSQND